MVARGKARRGEVGPVEIWRLRLGALQWGKVNSGMVRQAVVGSGMLRLGGQREAKKRGPEGACEVGGNLNTCP